MINGGPGKMVSRPAIRLLAGRRAIPQSVLDSVRDRRPRLLGFSFIPGLQAVYNALDELYTNWDTIVGDDAQKIVKAVADKYKEGYTREQASQRALAAAVAQSLNITKTKALTVIKYLEGITTEQYPFAASYLSPAGTSWEALKSGAVVNVSNAAASVKEGAADTLKEALDLAKQGAKEIGDVAPWYAKPQVIAPLLLIGLGFFYWNNIKQFLPKKKSIEYRPNPVKRTAKEEAAAKMYEKFSDLPAKRRRKIPSIDCSELADLGTALEIGYKSRKWTGKPANYLHQFGKGVHMYATPDGKTLVLNGGKMQLTTRGIEN